MQIKTTPIPGLVEILPTIFKDDRGWFYEFYKDQEFTKHNISIKFVQENKSFSKKGVVRGLHLQLPPFEQAKLVSVMSGRVLDVVVDVRKGSNTFGQSYNCVLDAELQNMLFIPEGFAHGFAALEDSVFFYKCSSHYHRESESGILWNDPDLKINWQIDNPILSEKDTQLSTLNELLRKSVISR
jgi:dTDP-4-dehydrorhamnose 3,5-epimerase